MHFHFKGKIVLVLIMSGLKFTVLMNLQMNIMWLNLCHIPDAQFGGAEGQASLVSWKKEFFSSKIRCQNSNSLVFF